MRTHQEDLFWIVAWISITFFSQAFLNVIYGTIEKYFGNDNSLTQRIIVMIVSFIFLYFLIRQYGVDLSRSQK